MSETKSLWQRWGWLARWGGTAIGLAYVATLIDVDSAKAALAKISAQAIVIACALIAANVAVGAVRWRMLLRAYGASQRPALGDAIRLYFAAFFYNNYLPGAVVGDVMRGVVANRAFGEEGTTGSIAVVLVERALGLFAVFSLVGVGLLLVGDALSDTDSLWWWSIGGMALGFVSVCMLPFGRKIARWIPAPLGGIAAKLPMVHSLPRFGLATLLSLVTQLLTALAGWVILADLNPAVTWQASLLVVPLAAATTFLPITVGGAGAREAVYIALCSKLFGMSADAGLAASLLFWSDR